jgi:hypothetical protein
MARSIEDWILLDVILPVRPLQSPPQSFLKGVGFGYAPRQYLSLLDVEIEQAFRHTDTKLKYAGAECVEIDLGDDFCVACHKANWPAFAHETMPYVTAYLKEIGAPAPISRGL